MKPDFPVLLVSSSSFHKVSWNDKTYSFCITFQILYHYFLSYICGETLFLNELCKISMQLYIYTILYNKESCLKTVEFYRRDLLDTKYF